MSFAQLWPETLAQITGGQLSPNGGGPQAQVGESLTIAANIATLLNAATLVTNSEIVTVIDATGSPTFYARGTTPASSSLAGVTNGVYSIAAGVLTFAAADTGLNIQVTYLYTPAVSTNNAQITLSQVGMNSAPTFELTLIGTGAKNIYNNSKQQFIVQLNSCLAPSLKLDFKLDDFTMADLDYQAFTDVNGTLGRIFMINASG